MRGWPAKPSRFSSRSAICIHCSRVSSSSAAKPGLGMKERLGRAGVLFGDLLQRLERGDRIAAEVVEAARLDKFHASRPARRS